VQDRIRQPPWFVVHSAVGASTSLKHRRRKAENPSSQFRRRNISVHHMFGPHGQPARQYGPETQLPPVAACRLRLLTCTRVRQCTVARRRDDLEVIDCWTRELLVRLMQRMLLKSLVAYVHLPTWLWLPVSGSALITIPRFHRWRPHLLLAQLSKASTRSARLF
jgi:hypothetical protein